MNKAGEIKPFTVALDIGTTKVCVLIGRRNEHGKLEVLGFGKVESNGVLRGVVSNIEKTVQAINEAIRKAERMAGFSVRHVNVGIAGQHIKSIQHRGILTRDNSQEEINDSDIDRLIMDMHKLQLPPGEKIIHIIPQEYTVDNEQGIIDPRGMSGVRLEANFHIVTGQVTAIQNLNRCIEKSQLTVDEITLEPIASGTSVLSQEEKDAGVALVDIGGGTTDITIFHEGIIRHTAVIPFGGNVITKDIKEGCNIMVDRAEKLKVQFGSALASEVFDNLVISIPGLKGHGHKEITEKNLARIIQARVEEILDYVMWEIQKAGFERKLVGGIVLTGGGAMLRHIAQLTAYHTGLTTRVGQPNEHLAHGYPKDLASPIYSTALGLLLRGMEKPYLPEEDREEIYNSDQGSPDTSNTVEETGSGWFNRMFERAKDWIKEEQDSSL
ncbi:MAG: cell division protein FtsA [Lewinellaceae bacterium]|nr:cell division protein FtsA [Saprospiraceae bacterium]MCB9311284.1 cell division protein FtsA [Lewinellaceae bacterium]